MWRNDYLENDISFVSLLYIFYYGSLQKRKTIARKRVSFFYKNSHKSKLQILKDIKQIWIIIWLVPFPHNCYLK